MYILWNDRITQFQQYLEENIVLTKYCCTLFYGPVQHVHGMFLL